MSFSSKIKEDALVASARHCCVCHLRAGLKVEIHHIIPQAKGGQDTFDNAIALCLHCHADVGHYFAGHPKGTKLSPSELRKHRDTWYKRVTENNIQDTDLSNSTITQIKYLQVKDYIRRKVREYSEWNFQIYIDRDKYEPQPLMQHIVDGEKRIVLYSNAQIGKSTELKNLAFVLYDSGLYNPFFFDLSNYSNKFTLEEQLKISKRFGNEKINVLILDGLDEVSDNNRNEVIKEIEIIAENHLDLFIVVACRKNFEGTNSISKFQKLYLNELSWNDSKAYIIDKCKHKSKALINKIEGKEYYELTRNPFYLKTIIEYYEQNNTLPANQTGIYDYIIDKSFGVDGGRRPQKGKFISPKATHYPTIEKLAFCMQLTQRQEFSADELFTEFGIDETDIDQLLTCSLLSSDKNCMVKFAHNSFKEYIFAKHLSTLSFERVQDVICYTGTQKIKPSMYNSTVLLLSIASKNAPLSVPLLDWLKADHKKLLVECGEEMLDEQQRNQIFKELFNDYKDKRLRIDYDSRDMLIKFANTKEILLFLLNEIREEVDYTHNMISAIDMLKYAKFSMLQSAELDSATKLLLEVLDKYKDNREYEPYFFSPFENECLLTTAIVSRIYDIIKETTNCHSINHFCTLISKTCLSDDYADWVFNKAGHIHDYRDAGGTIHSISMEYLYKVFRSFRNPFNIVKAIAYAKERTDKDFFGRNKEEPLFEELFANLTKYSDGDAAIIDEVIRTVMSTKNRELSTSYIDGFYKFLEAKTDTQQLFEEYYCKAKDSFTDYTTDNSKHNGFEQNLNVVVLLLNDDRFDCILSDDSFPDESHHYGFCSHLCSYPSINGNFTAKIQTRFAKFYEYNDYWSGLPYSGCHNTLFFFDYLAVSVSEKLLDDEIEKMILSEVDYISYHWSVFVKHIVDHKKENFYRYFERIMTKSDSSRLNLVQEIIKLGREGVEIMKPLLPLLDESELIL